MRKTALILALLTPLSAQGGETAWQDLAPGTRARLISSDVQAADGTTLVALEIDMPEKVKTYWRIPGETGIPTQLDFSGSEGVTDQEILWPFPLVDRSQGYLDYVYYGPTVLPIELKIADDATKLEASVVMGICSDICVPATASFSLPLDFAKADAGHGLRIRQAVANTPIPWDHGQDPIGEVGFDPRSSHLEVRVADPGVKLESIIATLEGGNILFGTPQRSHQADLVQLPMLGSGGVKGLEGQSVQLTYMTPSGPYQTTREILPRRTLSAGQ